MVYSDNPERWVIRDWLRQHEWDIAAVFTIPKNLMVRLNLTCIRADEVSLSQLLARSFNELDRKVFKSAHRRKGVRIQRFVGLERTEEVGWHAHVSIKAPAHVTPSSLSLELQRIWLRQLKAFDAGDFETHLYWAAPYEGGYDFYSTKKIGGGGAADWRNAVLNPSSTKSAQTRQ